MAEIDLLRRYPRAKRNIEKRTVAQNEENIRIAWQYGREYFDGSWDTGIQLGPHYSTAMALIILQVPNNYLPILQR